MLFLLLQSFLFLIFLTRGGVNILGYAFAVESWREPLFVEVVVYHRHATRAGLTYLALVRLKFRLRRSVGLCLLTCLGWLWLRHFSVCAADFAVDMHRRLPLHGIGDMTINVECGLGADVAYHSGESLDIHLGYKDSENKHSFPDYTEEKAKYLYDVLVGIADYVIVDCMSIPDSNFLTSVTDLSYERSIFLCKNKKVAVSGKNNADAEAHIWRFCVC